MKVCDFTIIIINEKVNKYLVKHRPMLNYLYTANKNNKIWMSDFKIKTKNMRNLL